MDKFEHIATMFNVRTRNKKYENYIVNAIYSKVGNHELMPITQQYVKSKKDNRYYLLDLYFPQINYGVEVDEMQHIGEQHTISDKERSEAIKEAISCEEKRIELYHKIRTGEKDSAQMRSFDDILAQIDRCVEEIKELIQLKEKSGEQLKWQTDEEKREEVFERGVLRIVDDVNYKGFESLSAMIGYYRTRKCGTCVNNNYFLWVPHLAVQDEDGKVLYSRDGWENYLSKDGLIITEVDTKDRMVNNPSKEFSKNLHRVVFMKMRDKYGKQCCRFIGVFQPQEWKHNKKGHIERCYKRIATEVNIDLLKK